MAKGDGPNRLSFAPSRTRNRAPRARSCTSGPTKGTVDGNAAIRSGYRGPVIRQLCPRVRPRQRMNLRLAPWTMSSRIRALAHWHFIAASPHVSDRTFYASSEGVICAPSVGTAPASAGMRHTTAFSAFVSASPFKVLRSPQNAMLRIDALINRTGLASGHFGFPSSDTPNRPKGRGIRRSIACLRWLQLDPASAKGQFRREQSRKECR